MTEVVWNPERAPDDEDAVILVAHQHSRYPTKILGSFHAMRQEGPRSAVFVTSDFDLPFREAFGKAMAYARAHGMARLYVQDPHGFGSMEVRER